LNRKKADIYQPAYKILSDIGFKALLERVENGDTNARTLAESNFTLTELQQDILNGTKIKQLNG